MAARVGLLVNPAAGRDVRRLTGGASVSDTYGKRRVAECVLAGVALADDPVEVVVAPDASDIGPRAAADTDASAVRVLDLPIEGTATDTRHATERFRDEVDVVVSLGGDGTTRDVAVEIGDVPLLAVSTGTNNVVPTAVDGTAAGAAAALVATGAVDADEVTTRHTMLEVTTGTAPSGESGQTWTAPSDEPGHTETAPSDEPGQTVHHHDGSLHGLGAVGVVDQSFVGTRAVLDAGDYLTGVVSRASRGAIGLPGVAGALTSLAPDEGRGVAVDFDPAADGRVTAITVPGVVDRLGVADWRYLDPGDEHAIEVEEAVVTADGERELEVQNTTVHVRLVPGGPRLVDVDAVFAAAPRSDWP